MADIFKPRGVSSYRGHPQNSTPEILGANLQAEYERQLRALSRQEGLDYTHFADRFARTYRPLPRLSRITRLGGY